MNDNKHSPSPPIKPTENDATIGAWNNFNSGERKGAFNVFTQRHTCFQKLLTSCWCCTIMQHWWRRQFSDFEEFVHTHHWKMLLTVFILGFLCFGLKSVSVNTDFYSLWVEDSDRLASEWRYLANAVSIYSDPLTLMAMTVGSNQFNPTSGDAKPMFMSGSKSRTTLSGGLPGRESMHTVETIIQTSTSYLIQSDLPQSPSSDSSQSSSSEQDVRNSLTEGPLGQSGQILSPRALLDHLEFLLKVHRLEVTVESSKWSFRDLCLRSSLTFGAEMHRIESYLDMMTPCLIVTPLDCFWEGSKVLGPVKPIFFPLLEKQTLFRWTNLDPVGLLLELQKQYGNHSGSEISDLINTIRRAGIDHGYLNRTCLDPTDPACPSSAPNYNGQPPNVPSILNGGCPGFASKMLHWKEDFIIGGRRYSPRFNFSQSVREPDSIQLTNTDSTSTIKQFDGNYDHLGTIQSSNAEQQLSYATALQSMIFLRSPRDLYEVARSNDPYKHESLTIDDAQHVLDEWRRGLRRLVVEHSSGLQSDSNWQFYALTDSSLRDLLHDITLRLKPIQIAGCGLLVLYGIISLLDWHDPIRSQCWLAFAGFFTSALSLLAGLGICAMVGLPFNVLTIQILPFLLMGLGVDALFTLSTCYDCSLARRVTSARSSPRSTSVHAPNDSLIRCPSNVSLSTCSSNSSNISPSKSSSSSSINYTPSIRSAALVLPEHGTSLLFDTFAIAGAFFAGAFIPIPLTRQFCLQAGILVLVQTISNFFLFPALLQVDGYRRSQGRLDVFCCVRQVTGVTGSSRTKVPVYHSTYITNIETESSQHPYSCQVTNPSNRSTPYPPKLSSPIASNTGRCSHVTDDSSRSESAGVLYPSIQVNVINQLSDNASATTIKNYCSPGSSCSGAVDSSVRVPHSSHTEVIVTRQQQQKQNSEQAEHELHSFQHRRHEKRPKCSLHGFPGNQTFETTHNHRHTRPMVKVARRLGLLLTSHWSVQFVVCMLGLAPFILAGFFTMAGLQLDMDWSSLAPSDTVEHEFIKTYKRAFGLCNFHIVTRGTDLPDGHEFTELLSPTAPRTSSVDSLAHSRISYATIGRGTDFPIQQRRLRQLYTQLLNIPNVFLTGNQVWLDVMGDWLQSVQDAFDVDRKRESITADGHWTMNATKLGIMGLHLMVQTDRGLDLSRITTGRLIHSGVIYRPAFYALLRAWRSFDALNFTSMPCLIYPEPSVIHTVHLNGKGGPSDLYNIPPAEKIQFVQTSYYVSDVREMDAQLKLIREVRKITERSTNQGVPSFPTGFPFTVAEHFLHLFAETGIALGIFFLIILGASFILFSSPFMIVMLLLAAGFGVSSFLCAVVTLGLALNPVSVVLLIISGGLGARAASGFLGSWTTTHQFRISHFFQSKRHHLRTASTHISQDTHHFCASQCCTYCFIEHKHMGRAKRKVRLRVEGDSCVENTPAASVSTSRSQSRPKLGRENAWCNQQVRSKLIVALSNQFAASVHTALCLILAMVSLAAARVQFVADYFFYLIAVVSISCLFVGTCLTPVLCYLLYPVRQPSSLPPFIPAVDSSKNSRSLFPRRKVERTCQRMVPTSNTGPVSEVSTTDRSYVMPLNDIKRTAHPLNAVSSTLPSTECNFAESTGNIILPPSMSVSSLCSNASCNSDHCLELPSSISSEADVHQVQSVMNRVVDVFPSRNSSIANQVILRKRPEDCLPPHRPSNWLNLTDDCQSPESAAAACAAAVFVAAATAASSSSTHQRPASLSTIFEEDPSYSSSTISLNRIPTPPHTESVEINRAFEPNCDESVSSKHSIHFSADQHHTANPSMDCALENSVDLLHVTGLFNLTQPVSVIYKQLCQSFFSETQSKSGTHCIDRTRVTSQSLPSSQLTSRRSPHAPKSGNSHEKPIVTFNKDSAPPPYASIIMEPRCTQKLQHPDVFKPIYSSSNKHQECSSRSESFTPVVFDRQPFTSTNNHPPYSFADHDCNPLPSPSFINRTTRIAIPEQNQPNLCLQQSSFDRSSHYAHSFMSEVSSRLASTRASGTDVCHNCFIQPSHKSSHALHTRSFDKPRKANLRFELHEHHHHHHYPTTTNSTTRSSRSDSRRCKQSKPNNSHSPPGTVT